METGRAKSNQALQVDGEEEADRIERRKKKAKKRGTTRKYERKKLLYPRGKMTRCS